jgi:hypothetical protein
MHPDMAELQMLIYYSFAGARFTILNLVPVYTDNISTYFHIILLVSNATLIMIPAMNTKRLFFTKTTYKVSTP